jgi:hypothetical protein
MLALVERSRSRESRRGGAAAGRAVLFYYRKGHMLALVERVLKQQRQELADALELLMHALGVA